MDRSRLLTCDSALMALSSTVEDAEKFDQVPIDCQGWQRAESTHIQHVGEDDQGMNMTKEPNTPFKVLAVDSDDDGDGNNESMTTRSVDPSLVRWHMLTYSNNGSSRSGASSKRLLQRSLLGRHSVLLHDDDDDDDEKSDHGEDEEVDVDALWGNLKPPSEPCGSSLRLQFNDSNATSTIGVRSNGRPKKDAERLRRTPLSTTKIRDDENNADKFKTPQQNNVSTQVSFSEDDDHSSLAVYPLLPHGNCTENCADAIREDQGMELWKEERDHVAVQVSFTSESCDESLGRLSDTNGKIKEDEQNGGLYCDGSECNDLNHNARRLTVSDLTDNKEDKDGGECDSFNWSTNDEEVHPTSAVRHRRSSIASDRSGDRSFELFMSEMKEVQDRRKLDEEQRRLAWERSLDSFINDDTSEEESCDGFNSSFHLLDNPMKVLNFSSKSLEGSGEDLDDEKESSLQKYSHSSTSKSKVDDLSSAFNNALSISKDTKVSDLFKKAEESLGEKDRKKCWRNKKVLAFLEPSSSESSYDGEIEDHVDDEENKADSEEEDCKENWRPRTGSHTSRETFTKQVGPTYSSSREEAFEVTSSREPLSTKVEAYQNYELWSENEPAEVVGKTKRPLGITKGRTFMDSLSLEIPDESCHPEARRYLTHFSRTKNELALKLYSLFNTAIFDSRLPLDMSIEWKPRLTKTAGRCHYKIDRLKMERYCIIDLSSKVIDSADRLRDTLIHEMCHAAVYLISGSRENHGRLFKNWGRLCVARFPELPLIERCHTYEIFTKYIYRCERCGLEYRRHSKSIKETASCGRCGGKLLLNVQSDRTKKSTEVSTPRNPNPFALFVKENYKHCRTPGSTHKEAMDALSKMFARSKLN